MIVSEIMSRDVKTATPETSYRDLWKRIFATHVHTLPIVDENNKLLGIVTRKDLLARLYPKYQDVMDYLETAKDFEAMEERMREMTPLKARDIMSKTVIFTRENTLIMRALSRMIVRNVDQLPVVSDKDEVLGVVTKGDIFYCLFRKHFQPNAKMTRPKHHKKPAKKRQK
jgi:CBS domain-containing membrane protein